MHPTNRGESGITFPPQRTVLLVKATSEGEEKLETIRLCIGTLDTPVPAKPLAHIFVSEKAEWFDIHDDIPQYPQGSE